MRRNEMLNKKVVKALAVGATAVMLMQPVGAIADEGNTDVSVPAATEADHETVDNEVASAKDKIDTIKTDLAKATSTEVANVNDTKLGDFAEVNDLIDAYNKSVENANKDVVALSDNLKNIDTSIDVHEAAEKVVEDKQAALATEKTGLETLVKNADDELSKVKDELDALDTSTASTQNVDDLDSKAQKVIDDAKEAIEAEKKDIADAEAAVEKAVDDHNSLIDETNKKIVAYNSAVDATETELTNISKDADKVIAAIEGSYSTEFAQNVKEKMDAVQKTYVDNGTKAIVVDAKAEEDLITYIYSNYLLPSYKQNDNFVQLHSTIGYNIKGSEDSNIIHFIGSFSLQNNPDANVIENNKPVNMTLFFDAKKTVNNGVVDYVLVEKDGLMPDGSECEDLVGGKTFTVSEFLTAVGQLDAIKQQLSASKTAVDTAARALSGVELTKEKKDATTVVATDVDSYKNSVEKPQGFGDEVNRKKSEIENRPVTPVNPTPVTPTPVTPTPVNPTPVTPAPTTPAVVTIAETPVALAATPVVAPVVEEVVEAPAVEEVVAEAPVAEEVAEAPVESTEIAEEPTALASEPEVEIGDEATPLATLEEKQKMSWWWLLIVLVLGTTGAELFRRHQLKKKEAAKKED